MKNAFTQLRHLAAELEIGVTARDQLCPFCNGGQSNERAFALTRTTEFEAKYCCHRASCGKVGRIAVWGFRLDGSIPGPSTQKRKPFTPRLHTAETRELGEGWIAELLDQYEITESEATWAGWREELGSNYLVCPVRSPLGVVRGHEIRRSKVQIPYVAGPKTKSYRILDVPWLGWYRRVDSRPVVLVEDHISALKVSRHFPAICLHGCHVTLEMLMEVLEVVGISGDIALALDKDATAKALKFVTEWRFLAPNFRCVPLEKDLKYVSDKEILACLKA